MTIYTQIKYVMNLNSTFFSRSLALCISALFVIAAPVWAGTESALSDRLRQRVEIMLSDELSTQANTPLHNAQTVSNIYLQRGFGPIWHNKGGANKPLVQAFLQGLQETRYHGLLPNDYHLAALSKITTTTENSDPVGAQVDAELRLTDALLLYVQHMRHGKVDPETAAVQTKILPNVLAEVETYLSDLTESRLTQWLSSLPPSTPRYLRMVQELKALEEKQAPAVSIELPIKLGQSTESVLTVSQLLANFGYLDPSQVGSTFNAAIRQAVMAFQAQHSLDSDGAIGPATRRALIALVRGDEQALRVNLERARWMPNTPTKHNIWVNIADYKLRYQYGKQPVLQMKTVVGRNYRKTPIFSADMRYVVVNPSWHVPQKIATKDLLPKYQANPELPRAMGMQVFQGWGKDMKQIDLDSIDWQQYTAKTFPFHLKQQPGEKNALGKVKFMFPNEHSVYIHDTNDHSLFNKSARAFSSGCIRLEKPIDLLQIVLANHSKFDVQKLPELLASGKETTILLSDPIPVHIQYWTVWVDDDNRVHYRHDIYERDAGVLNGLETPLL